MHTTQRRVYATMKTTILSTFILLTGVRMASSVHRVHGTVGGTAVFRCPYSADYNENQKYLCRGACSLYDKDVPVQTTVAGQSRAQDGRFYLHDDTASGIFTVTITALTAKDAGKYWCGVRKWSLDLYTELWLDVGTASAITQSPDLVTRDGISLKSTSAAAVACAVVGVMAALLVLLGVLIHLKRRHKGSEGMTGLLFPDLNAFSSFNTDGTPSILGMDHRSTEVHPRPISVPNPSHTHYQHLQPTRQISISTIWSTPPPSTELTNSNQFRSVPVRRYTHLPKTDLSQRNSGVFVPRSHSMPLPFTGSTDQNPYVGPVYQSIGLPSGAATNGNPVYQSIGPPSAAAINENSNSPEGVYQSVSLTSTHSPPVINAVYQSIEPPVFDPVCQCPPSNRLTNHNSHFADDVIYQCPPSNELTNQDSHVADDVVYQSPPSNELINGNSTQRMFDSVYQSMAPVAVDSNRSSRHKGSSYVEDVNADEYMTMQNYRVSSEI
ncbi:uncharacterized protein LOC134458126 [Engraulis encrasicolus]|uniref:uncharacterized protein LOC134458126 n=1 Tax=Engraulis encrasicolus TaxID=184585 RepID=UPI002FD14BB8